MSGASLVLRWALGASVAGLFIAGLGTGCSSDGGGHGADDDCEVGSERCACTQGGACDPGLECRSSFCVKSRDGTGGKAGGGSGGTSPGSGGRRSSPDASAPDGGGPDAKAPVLDADSDVAEAGPSVPACTTSAECGTTQVCVIKVDGTGFCLEGSGKPCDAGDLCVNAMGFDPLNGKIEGPACQTASDCVQGIEGHLNSVCIEGGGCAPLCQYRDDPAHLKCVTSPQIGLNPDCNRDQIRMLAAEAVMVGCVDVRLATWACKPSPRPLTGDEDWTLSCVGRAIYGGGTACYPLNCFPGSGSPAEAKLAFQTYLDLIDEFLDYSTTPIPGGGGSSDQCGADCDCGHCGYCESGTCRFGGEGPYGCYRGCD